MFRIASDRFRTIFESFVPTDIQRTLRKSREIVCNLLKFQFGFYFDGYFDGLIENLLAMPMFLPLIEMEATMDWNEGVRAGASRCRREAINSKTNLPVRSKLPILKVLVPKKGFGTPLHAD
jgi:hypothetical protein